MKPIVFVLGGPTASGKSLAAQHLGKAFGGAIINADSVQLYKELRLLTATPSLEEMGSVPHRLYGTLTSEDKVTAALWREWALQEIETAHRSQSLPILVGGSGFYLKALMEGLSPIPEIPPEIRLQGLKIKEEQGLEVLFSFLQKHDPQSAERLSPHDTHRILRAWEVWESTKTPLSVWQKYHALDAKKINTYRFVKIFINPEREYLYQKINDRVLKMMEKGALKEVENLLKLRLPLHHPLEKAVGVHELTQYLKGCISYEAAIEEMQTKTRQYAKRQITWFSNQFKADVMYPFLYEEERFEKFIREHKLDEMVHVGVENLTY